MTRSPVPTAVLVLLAVLVGCGGSEPKAPQEARTAPAPAPAAVPEVVVAPDGQDDAQGTAEAPLSLHAAVRDAKPPVIIRLRPGSYPRLTTDVRHAERVVVAGPNPTEGPRRRPAARIEGAFINGAGNLTIEDVAFTDEVRVESHAKIKERQPSVGIALRRVELTNPEGKCLSIRGAASDVSLAESWVHDCARGVLGSPDEATSSGITIEDNLFEDFSEDGISFASWDDVVIAGNVMRNFVSPESDVHNDGIQFMGNSRGVRIARNRIFNSEGQLLLVQPYFGPISDVVIENNLLVGSGAYAVQVQGTPRARVVNNTIWRSGYSALLIRPHNGEAPTDTVVTNNILSGLKIDEPAGIARRRANFIAGSAEGTFGQGDRTGADPGFVDPRAGDFRLREDSPLRGTAAAEPAPERNVVGQPRGARPNPGAY